MMKIVSESEYFLGYYWSAVHCIDCGVLNYMYENNLLDAPFVQPPYQCWTSQQNTSAMHENYYHETTQQIILLR